MDNKTSNTSREKESDREIISTRVFNVPREVLFKAWTDPRCLAKWWGPKGFTNTFHEFDLRPGGMWRFTMHAPNGINFENKCVFVDIVVPEKIVLTHLEPVHKFDLTATFQTQENKTKLIFRMLFESAAECNRIKSFVVEANEQNFDRLEAILIAIK